MRAEASATLSHNSVRTPMSTGVPAWLRHCTFATLDPARVTEAQGICREYARDTEYLGKRGLLLTGPPGSGKTNLAVAVLHQVLADREGRAQARFVAVPHGLVQARQRPPGRFGHHGLSPALAAGDLVVLDELGQHPVTPWVSEQLYLLFDELWAQDRPTVVTTDLPAAELVRRLRPELVSRVLGLCHEVTLTAGPRDGAPSPRSLTSTTIARRTASVETPAGYPLPDRVQRRLAMPRAESNRRRACGCRQRPVAPADGTVRLRRLHQCPVPAPGAGWNC